MSVLDLFKLDGKTAIITGGGRGLAAQIAEAYAEAGANIVVCSRRVEACEEMSEKLNKKGANSLAFKCDVTNVEDIKNVVKQTKNHFGSIDRLVNRSGATWEGPAEETPEDAWEQGMHVNSNGTVYMSQEVGKGKIEQKSGKSINLPSVAGFGGTRPFMQTTGYN